MTPRDRALERIRRTYAGYDEESSRRWDKGNPGFARLSHEADQLIARLVRRSADDRSRILDLGCGYGDLALVCRASGVAGQWFGIDLLADRIEQAQASVPGATFLVGSIDAIPFPDGFFDVLVAELVFSSIGSQEMRVAAAHEARRVLRPGGWLVWYDLRFDNPRNSQVTGLGRREIARLFPGWAAELDRFTLLPPLARRLGVTTRVSYPLLHSIPMLRSHLIGRLRCPIPSNA